MPTSAIHPERPERPKHGPSAAITTCIAAPPRHRRLCRSRHPVAGFTLIELLVVFAIMALLVGLVPLAFERMREGAHYRDTLRAIAAEMRAARQQALSQRQETRFVLDLSQRTYAASGRPERSVPEPLQLRATVAGIESQDQQVAIRFHADGGSTGGSIEILRPSGTGARLQVDWLSGRVTQEALLP